MIPSDRQLFDFNAPIHNSDQSFADFVREAETSAQTYKIHRSGQQTLKSLLLFVLTLNIIGLGAFGYFYVDQNRQNQATVAGVQDTAAEEQSNSTLGSQTIGANVVSGNGYSVVSPNPIPSGYRQSSEPISIPYLNNRPATLHRYLIDDTQTGRRIRTGFEITRTPYDDELTQVEFVEALRRSLGENEHPVVTRNLRLPKNVRATVLDSTNESEVEYYVVTTPVHYFVIKIYNQTKGLSEFQEYTDFIENLPNTLCLT